MSVYVVDSSVAIKWYVPEVHQPDALRLLGCGVPLHSPDFLDVEVAAVLWKKLRRGVLTRPDADDILTELLSSAVPVRHPSVPLVADAFDLADQSGRTVYDCLYLALAVRLGGRMVTADDKLVNGLAGTAWAAFVMHVRDVP